ncbi:universal stress protein [Luteibacter sp.]|uniref:universal stress protein n=1 Tax=Luteibacter sp. TaxID=1886636 RepID=UPI003F7F1BA1
MYKHILLLVPNREPVTPVVARCLRFAATMGARVTAMFVTLTPPAADPVDADDEAEGRVYHLDACVGAARREAQRSGVSIQCLQVAGSAAEDVIVRRAEMLGCDLIVAARGSDRHDPAWKSMRQLIDVSRLPVLAIGDWPHSSWP